MDYEQAIAAGAMALFGEKYDTPGARAVDRGVLDRAVRRHARAGAPGDIGLFHIVERIRRRRGRAPHRGASPARRRSTTLRAVDAAAGGRRAIWCTSSREELADKVREALERMRALEKENRALKDKLALGQGTDLAAQRVDIDGVKVLATRVDGADAGALRAAVDQLKSRLGSAIIVLGSVRVGLEGAAGRGRYGGSDRARQGGGTYRRRRGPSWRQGRRSRRILRRPEAASPRRSTRHWPASCRGCERAWRHIDYES